MELIAVTMSMEVATVWMNGLERAVIYQVRKDCMMFINDFIICVVFSPVSTTAPEGIQIWLILLPVLLLLSIVVGAVVLAVVLVLKNRSNKRKLKIQPVDSVGPVEDTDIAGDDENSLTITRSKSLVRVIRRRQLQSETGKSMESINNV